MNKNYIPLTLSNFIVGRGSLDCISQFTSKRAAIIHGGKSMPEKMKNRVRTLIESGGGECRFIAKITNEPFFSDIKKAANAMNEYQPDLIIAIGGGAVLDTAKAIHLFYEYPDLSIEDSLKPYQLPALGIKADMIAVPTTSGTGSETTSAAVFTDDETNRKHLMLANVLIPKYAVLDSDLTDSLPDSIASQTGMDALTHAMEASVCSVASPMVVSIAVGAALDILENLKISALKDIDMDKKRKAREACHVAASLAGVAITNSCAGLAHGFDQPGPFFGISHGQICGIMLPYTTAFTGVHPSYITLAKRLGLSGENSRELCQALVDYLVEFTGSLGIPASFLDAGVNEEAFMSKLDDFAHLATEAIATKLSPRVPTFEQAKDIFRNVYYGNKPVV